MPTQKQIRQFQQRVQVMHCRACGKTTRKTYAEVMATDRFPCEHCGKPLSFDKAKWSIQVFTPPPKDLNQRINERVKKRPRLIRSRGPKKWGARRKMSASH